MEHNGFRYHINRKNKFHKYLRCATSGCKAGAIEKNGQVNIVKPHNHKPLHPININKPPTNKTANVDEMISEEERKLKHPFNMVVGGASGSGKTAWIRRFLQSHKQMIDKRPEHVLYCYGVYDKDILLFQNMGIETFYGIPDEEKLKQKPKPLLVVFDDLMIDAKAKYLDMIFTRGSHHWDMSVIFVTQHLFNKQLSNARTNAHYIVLLRSPSSELQIRNLGTQLFPRNLNYFMEAYADATKTPFGYLLINNHPRGKDQLKLTTGIFPDDSLAVYSNSGNKILKKILINERDMDRSMENRHSRKAMMTKLVHELRSIRNDPTLNSDERVAKYNKTLANLRRLIGEREGKSLNVAIRKIDENLLEKFREPKIKEETKDEDDEEDDGMWWDERDDRSQFGSGIIFSKRPGLPMSEEVSKMHETKEEEKANPNLDFDDEEFQKILDEFDKKEKKKDSDSEVSIDEEEYQKFIEEWNHRQEFRKQLAEDDKYYRQMDLRDQQQQQQRQQGKGNLEKPDFLQSIIDSDLSTQAKFIEKATDAQIDSLRNITINMFYGRTSYAKRDIVILKRHRDFYHSLVYKRTAKSTRKLLLTKEGLKALVPLLKPLCIRHRRDIS